MLRRLVYGSWNGIRWNSNQISFRNNRKIFELSNESEVKELNLHIQLYKHLSSNAQYIHLRKKDEEKSFSCTFPTMPMDDGGAAHILEHVVLCGSEQYPCRDPFMKMIQRSFATFMNAMTSHDWTMYLYSTVNEKDYENLMRIYMDAVFFPLIREADFLQEGWRLAINEKGKNEVKGVVFNEMKGVFSDRHNLYVRRLFRHLLPSHTYSFESGGDPLSIPNDLPNVEDLRNFHLQHYSIDNAHLMSYGELNLEKQFDFLHYNFLSKLISSKRSNKEYVPLEKKWSKEKFLQLTSPVIEDIDREKQCISSISWCLNDVRDVEHQFAWQILSHLLCGTEKSPFYQRLLTKEKIGSIFSPDSGYHTHQRNCIFSIGVENMRVEEFDQFYKLIFETIDEIIINGFDPRQLDAILHSIELSVKEVKSNFGIQLFTRLIGPWMHGADIFHVLQINRQIKNLLKKLKENPKYFQEILKRDLIDNHHRLICRMEPDEKYSEKLFEEENELIKKLSGKISMEKIEENQIKLEEAQNEMVNESILPQMRSIDAKENLEIYPPTTIVPLCSNNSSVYHDTLWYYQQSTNDLIYFRFINNLQFPSMSQQQFHEKQLLLSFISSLFTSIGSKSMTYDELSEEIDLNTGGIDLSSNLVSTSENEEKFYQHLQLSSVCLPQNRKKMFQLFHDIYDGFQHRLNNESKRIRHLLSMKISSSNSAIPTIGHRYAMQLSRALLQTKPSIIQELHSGLHNLSFLMNLDELSDEDIRKLSFNSIHYLNGIISEKSSERRCAVHSSQTNLSSLLPNYKEESAKLFDQSFNVTSEMKSSTNLTISTNLFHQNEATRNVCILMPFNVNYVGRALETRVSPKSDDAVRLTLLSSILSNKFLLKQVREKGGAYGVGCTYSLYDGILSFFSYRDPQNIRTLKVFDESIKWISSNINEQFIEEAKIFALQNFDRPQLPKSRGLSLFMSKMALSEQNEFRSKIIDKNKEFTTIDQMEDTARRILLPLLSDKTRQSSVVIGSENLENFYCSTIKSLIEIK
ncbi:hypothetical protein SNEBB_011478 [Seison nebaliae]|nr:hypothetical protein SNEBB_011478 [Seison nebaliae]